jgi:hypothetical protein
VFTGLWLGSLTLICVEVKGQVDHFVWNTRRNSICKEHESRKEVMQNWLRPKVQPETYYFDGMRKLVYHWAKCSYSYLKSKKILQ